MKIIMSKNVPKDVAEWVGYDATGPTFQKFQERSRLHSDVSFHRAVIRIVYDRNKELWNAIKNVDDASFSSDYNILRILAVFDGLANDILDETKIELIQNILDAILNEGLNRPLSDEVLNQLINILCNLLNPMKNDASRGRSDLVTLMEKLAYARLTDTPCPSPEGTDLRADSFTVPSKLQIKVPGNTDCQDFFVIEYTSEQWFTKEPTLLSNKILAFEVKGGQSGYTTSPAKFKIHTPYGQRPSAKAQCVYYDFVSSTWINPQGTCQVVSDTNLGVDNFVECSCNHLTNYAVKAALDTKQPSTYNALFYVACFICMLGMAITVVAHHFAAAVSATFTANLLMHYCFACCATQLCYLVAAYSSPSEILVLNTDEDNYRCIIMGLFMHYFFSASLHGFWLRCFITNPYSALGGVIVPVLMVLLVIGVIFVKAFQITPQWQAYDDIYRGRYNINEIRTLLSFWAVMIFTWLWGGLHMAYAQTWMLIIFSIFNILQGILAVVLYTLLRNPCLQQCFGKQRDAYYMSNIGLFENGQSPQPSIEDIHSQNNSRISVSQKWDGDSTFSSKYPTINVKRALPASGNIYVSPSILVQSSKWNDGDEDFNDLLYALKDKPYFPENDVISLDSDKMSDLSNTINKFEMRRISIADTHL
ncbi:hypothetical protein FSP39_022715 [Pinctada imbricata]|uniref:GAIN-B domain-containing protein n=1 Tax=Pinctada imbricata TaxID=66713 RepID=A0AA88Y591_PINIB|nr:hypothetical protein FSP39_022715 [Pinctada imbricata]